jgi:hypothetical protein
MYDKNMSKINVLLANSAGEFNETQIDIINAIKEVEKYVFSKLKIDWDIDVVLTANAYSLIIPEDGVGGYTYASNFIVSALDLKSMSIPRFKEMLVHELCHAARWGKNDEWMNTLFDGMISEGVATYFGTEFAKNNSEKQFFTKTILERSDEENERILNELRGNLDDKNYDYNTIFFTGNDKMPRWSGYSLGYYLVKKYLEKTHKTIEEAFADKYEDFRIVL